MEAFDHPAANPLRISLLGPLRAWLGDTELALGTPQQRAVLALLLRRGRPAGLGDLIDGVWGTDAPPGAVPVLRTYVSRLRRLLEPDRAPGRPPRIVLSVGDGYAVETGMVSSDLDRFEDQVNRAGRRLAAGDHPTAARLLRTALDLWNGTPLVGIPGPYAEAERARLEGLRLGAQESWTRAELELGHHAAVLPDLVALRDARPLREDVCELLLIALYRCGRQAEALEVYASTRRTLVAELGIEPGPSLRAVHARLLAGDLPLARPAERGATARTGAADARTSGTGTGPPEPGGPDARAALYRSVLADRRALIVLDNARDTEQVRPLLPGAPGCLVVVTSRSRLSGLVAGQGAHPLTLDLPTAGEAHEMLARRLGAARIGAEPAAADAIVALCARLPLTVAVVAARAAHHPGFRLADIAGELRESHGSLDAFTGGEGGTDVRAVFSWSCEALPPETAELFRRLSLHPGPDLTVAAAAALAGVPPGRARALLAELTRASLLTEREPGRFVFHDLLRAYAAELADAEDTGSERRAALLRMHDHYLHTAHNAASTLDPFRRILPPPPGTTGSAPLRFDDRKGTTSWRSTAPR